MDALFPFQTEGAAWLARGRHRILADEMGLGKTVQAIRASEAVGAKRILVVCPAIAKATWVAEFAKWSVVSAELEVVSYEHAMRNVESLKTPRDLLVLDEVHYLKSTTAKRAHAVLGSQGLVHQAKRCYALSGTPAPNHAGELWTLLWVFGVTALNEFQFQDRYCVSGFGRQVTGTRREKIPELRELLSKVMLRRRKVDVLKDMPPLFFSTVEVEPGYVDDESLGFSEAGFEQLIGPEEYLERVEKERKILAATLSTQEKVAMLEAVAGSISTLRRYTGLQKVEPAAELVNGELALDLYDKVVVFAIHKTVVKLLAEALASWNPVVVTGGTPLAARSDAVAKFQNDPDTHVFIGNIQAAGTNITLTAAHQILFVEQDFVPGNNAQAAMRCHRIGQTRAVSVRFVTLTNALERRLGEILRRKTSELAQIFDF